MSCNCWKLLAYSTNTLNEIHLPILILKMKILIRLPKCQWNFQKQIKSYLSWLYGLLWCRWRAGSCCPSCWAPPGPSAFLSRMEFRQSSCRKNFKSKRSPQKKYNRGNGRFMRNLFDETSKKVWTILSEFRAQSSSDLSFQKHEWYILESLGYSQIFFMWIILLVFIIFVKRNCPGTDVRVKYSKKYSKI